MASVVGAAFGPRTKLDTVAHSSSLALGALPIGLAHGVTLRYWPRHCLAGRAPAATLGERDKDARGATPTWKARSTARRPRAWERGNIGADRPHDRLVPRLQPRPLLVSCA